EWGSNSICDCPVPSGRGPAGPPCALIRKATRKRLVAQMLVDRQRQGRHPRRPIADGAPEQPAFMKDRIGCRILKRGGQADAGIGPVEDRPPILGCPAGDQIRDAGAGGLRIALVVALVGGKSDALAEYLPE